MNACRLTPKNFDIDTKNAILKSSHLFQTSILGIYVSFRGRTSNRKIEHEKQPLQLIPFNLNPLKPAIQLPTKNGTFLCVQEWCLKHL